MDEDEPMEDVPVVNVPMSQPEEENEPMEDLGIAGFQCMFINLGQGDCTLIKCPDGRIGMIDCGSVGGIGSSRSSKASRIFNFIASQIKAWSGEYIYPNTDPPQNNKNVLEFLILTHCDQDHYNKLISVLKKKEGFTIKKVYFSGGPNSIGPQSDYARSDSTTLPTIPDSERSLSNYKVGKLYDKVLTQFWGTEQAIEVVINEDSASTYTYDLSPEQSSEPGSAGRDAQFGKRAQLDETSLEIISGETSGLGPWAIDIIAGNVLKTRTIKTEVPAAQLGKRNRNAITNQTVVSAPYKNSKTKNTASLCTMLTYPVDGNGDEKNCVLLMGDATNLTLEYLQNKVNWGWNNYICILSNIPHHGSSTECNDVKTNQSDQLMGAIPEPNNAAGFIQNVLKPESAIASTLPTSTMYKLPRELATNNYFPVTNSFDEHGQHLLDVWQSSDSQEGKDQMKAIKEQRPASDYNTKTEGKKNPTTWYTLKTVPTDLADIPDGGLAYMINYELGFLLRRIKTAQDVKIISLNSESGNSDFQYILRKFPEFEAPNN